MKNKIQLFPGIFSQFVCLLSVCIFTAFANAQSEAENALKSIDFRTNAAKEAIIIVELTTPAAVVDLKPVNEGLSIELLNTSVTDEQLYLLDVKDFSTVVESVEVFRDVSKARLVANISGEFRHDYRLSGRYLEVTISRLASEQEVKEQSVLEKEGKLISINFQDIPVRNVLQLIADYNGFNLVVSDSVTGNVTLRLDGVPWQQVLDIILQVKGLDKRVDGNVVLVAPKEELDLREKQQLKKSD